MSLPNPSAHMEETLNDFDDTMMAAFNTLQVDDAPETGASAPKTLFSSSEVETDIVDPLDSPFVTPSSTSAPFLQSEPQQLISSDDVNLRDTSTPAPANGSWFSRKFNSVAKLTATLTSTPSASKSVSFRNEASTLTFPVSSTVPEVTPPPSATPFSTDNTKSDYWTSCIHLHQQYGVPFYSQWRKFRCERRRFCTSYCFCWKFRSGCHGCTRRYCRSSSCLSCNYWTSIRTERRHNDGWWNP